MKNVLTTLVMVFSIYTISAQAPGCPQVDAGPDQNLTCANNCATLTATAFQTGLTTDYTVSSVPYAPPYSFTGGTGIFVNSDDIWSSVINLPFTFCFYGNNYNQLIVGANGLLSFDLSMAGNYCEWSFSASIPTPGPPPGGIYNNSINGAYHDIDPSTFWGNADINYKILGTSPCRTFVVNYYDVDHYDCESGIFSSGKQTTQQIVLYETTNAIEVYIRDKPVCGGWNGGRAVIGLQNSTGTQGITPPGRNTGSWSASNEAWRFTPSGVSNTTINWYDGNMNLVSTGNSISVCPTGTTTYTAEAVYDRCDGTQVIEQDQVTLNVAGGYTTSASVVDEGCAGSCDGSIIVTTTGGTPPFTFDIGNGTQSNGTFTGLCAGNYTVTISDNGGCTGTQPLTVSAGSAITVSEALINASCGGYTDGSATLTATGGIGTSTYDIGVPPTNTTGVFTGLAAGNYNYTVTDNIGCTYTSSFTITEPSPILLSATITDASCGALPDGAVDLTAVGGTGAYTYSWSNSEVTQDLSNVPAGVYDVLVTDANGCTVSGSYTVGQPVNIIITDTITDVLCNGDSTGAISIGVSGGTGPYTYIWSNSEVTEDISGLAAGTYDVTVYDLNQCTSFGSFVVSEPTALSISAQLTDPTCVSGTGAIDVTVTGGSQPYTYLWSTSDVSEDLTGLNGGTYDVVVTDVTGCTLTASYTLTPPATFTVADAIVDATCAAGADGSIDITVTGGTQPITYLWSNNEVTEDITGLTAGTYIVTITDINGCSITPSYVVGAPPPIVINDQLTDVSCNGGNDGAVNLTVLGGTGPYSFIWSNNEVTEDITGLVVGTYDVTVYDTYQCSATASYSINEPLVLTVTGTVTDALCNGSSDGTIDITATGGTQPYSYLWSNNAVTEDLSGLTQGTYDVTVTDDNQCTVLGSFVVNEPSLLTVSATTLDASCAGATDGAVDATVLGGTAPYRFSWSNNDTTIDLTNLTADTYDVTVTDANQCTTTGSYVVSEPAPIVITGTVTDASCYTSTDGAIDVTVTGGVQTLSYLWSSLETTEDLNNKQAGTYILTVTDATNCSVSSTFNIVSPDSFAIEGVTADASCFGFDDGSIDVTVSGSVPPYTYGWTNNANTQDLTDIVAGTYTLTITDAANCVDSVTYTIAEPPLLSIDSANIEIACVEQGNGAVYPAVSGGTGTLRYTWSNGTEQYDLAGVQGGEYTLTITDDNGCTSTDSFTVPADSLNMTIAVSPDTMLDLGEEVTFNVTGNTIIDDIAWSPIDYLDDPTATEVHATPEVGVYTYTAVGTNPNGCQDVSTVTIWVGNDVFLYIPNAFTPNGDGLNDYFNYESSGTVEVVRFWIFNRWGEKIFSGVNGGPGWDGTEKGQLANPGVYVYVIDIKYKELDDDAQPTAHIRKFKGSVTLISK